MATYKLIQDIEAEDHILGPLTLRQFIFGMIASFFFYLSYFVAVHGASFLLAIFLPPGLFCAFFAFPFGKDQPTEIWFLAKLRYWFLPRRRIWDQSGVKELVTITAPKVEQPVLTDGLSQTEVKSRLQALANTIDSRGWAVKNVNPTYAQQVAMAGDSQRLINLDSIPREVPADDITVSDDILDTDNSPLAQQVNSMVNQSAQVHRQRLIEELKTGVQSTQSNWFMSPAMAGPSVVSMPSAGEQQLAAQLKKQSQAKNVVNENLRTVQPLGAPAASAGPVNDPSILALANNDDLNVATIAREAHKAKGEDDPNEVVISLR